MRVERARINIEELQKMMGENVTGMEYGYFVTLNSTQTEKVKKLSTEKLYEFSNIKLVEICKAINTYCFGRSYKRGENKFKIVVAIEIGKETNRLHAHLLLLNQAECKKTIQEVEKRLRQICKPVLRMTGENAVDVKVFDSSRKWQQYFTKSTALMYSKYDGFMNVEG
jgi:hypothetical protein